MLYMVIMNGVKTYVVLALFFCKQRNNLSIFMMGKNSYTIKGRRGNGLLEIMI